MLKLARVPLTFGNASLFEAAALISADKWGIAIFPRWIAREVRQPKRSFVMNQRRLSHHDARPLRPQSEDGSLTPDSSTGNRRMVRRCSVICSSGSDQFTFDSRCDPNDPGTPRVPRLLRAEDPHVTVKRDSMLHPGRMAPQRSLRINGRFQNPWPTWRPPSITNIFKFGLSRDNSNVPSKQELELVLPVMRPRFQDAPEEGVRVTWLGHSTALVQFEGLSLLTDPMLSERASPSQLLGPKRYREAPCRVENLPTVHAVLISHNHYDHLDMNTVSNLNARFGESLRWFVPLGLKSWMENMGCDNVVELDWWEENCILEHGDISFVFTPAQHWCKRTVGDDNKVLWGSWCVLGQRYRFFFAGDTGYCDAFKQVGQVYGPFDLAAIPIGAYEPRWFMKYQHVNPEEAVLIHEDVRSKASLAIHWGTFALANEYYLDPPVKLRESLERHNIPPSNFFTLKHGESRLLHAKVPSHRRPSRSIVTRVDEAFC